MKKILFCWIGITDLNASKGVEHVGVGPIGQAALSLPYDEISLLSNFDEDASVKYVNWLQEQIETKISYSIVSLTAPTDLTEIYLIVDKHLAETRDKLGVTARFTFHLSPGTPAMMSIWILLSKTRYPADLIESSKEYGVKKAVVPFEISADFLPELSKNPDDSIQRLANGLPPEAPEFDDIVHRSKVMQKVVLRARHIASQSVPVLIEGDSGSGKELFARAIHDSSPRKHKPFIAINCGAIPAELVESEFFGHEKGAFTGADKRKIGHFEAAHGGTIFLDELGELPKEMQVKLLRTLQESEIRRVGSSDTIHVDFRVIAATNRHLIEEVTAGAFREDLFYRLAVAVLNLPPLRDREGDINLLVDAFIAKFNKERKQTAGYVEKRISVSARNLLARHCWPGNVRELQNTIIRAAIWSTDSLLTEADIQDALLPLPGGSSNQEQILDQPIEDGIDLQGVITKVATHYLQRALELHHNNKTKAAETLHLPSYQTLTNWLKKYGLE